jgi:hypothetical protein
MSQVIGRNPTGEPTPTPAPTQTFPKAPLLPQGPLGLNANIAAAGGNVGLNIPSDKNIVATDFVNNLTNAQIKQIIPYLKVFGASKAQLSLYPEAKKYLKTDLSTLVEASGNDFDKLISLFETQFTGYGGTGDGKPKSSGVTKYITEKSPEVLRKDVDDFLLKTIGSTNIKEESRKKIMDEIDKLIKEGTTTTTKRDKSGKDTVVQTPGYSDERAGEIVERVAKELEPEKFKQQEELTFFDFIQQAEQMRGGR